MKLTRVERVYLKLLNSLPSERWELLSKGWKDGRLVLPFRYCTVVVEAGEDGVPVYREVGA